MWISLINRVYNKLPYKLIDITETSIRRCSVKGPTQKMEISNIDTVVSVSDEHRKIILLQRQLLENKHKLELTQLKLNDEIQMLKLLKLNDEIQMLKRKHALDMLQVEQSFTNWEAMRHVNALNIRSFIYEFESKHFTEFGHIKTRREKYSAFAKKNLSILKKYCATEDLFVDLIMGFYKRQCESAHPEFNVNLAVIIPESVMLKQDLKILGILWILYPLPSNKLLVATAQGGLLCVQKYLYKHKDEW